MNENVLAGASRPREDSSPPRCALCKSTADFGCFKVTIHEAHRIYRCPTCGGYFLWPQMKVEYQASPWTDKRSKQWRADLEQARKSVPRIIEAAVRRMGRRPATVLEIGCGSGYLGVAFEENGCKYRGFDVDPYVIEHGRQHGLDVFVESAETVYDSPCGNRKYDLIISSNTFEHLEDPAVGFKLLARLCRGVAFVIVPNARGLFALLKANTVLRNLAFRIRGSSPRDTAYAIDGTWHNLAFTKSTLRYMCEQHQLEIIQLTSIGVNDTTFGFVQPNRSLVYRAGNLVPRILGMDAQLLLVTKASPRDR